MLEPISSSQVLTHASLAFFWAIVHALNAHRQGTSKTLLDWLILTIMSSFTWVMFTLVWLYIFPTATYLLFAMSGAGWYVWVEWMSFILWIIKNRIK